MNRTLLLLIGICGLASCSNNPDVTAEIKIFNDGSIVTNRDMLITQVHVVKSRTYLRDVAKELNLMELWSLDDAGAVDRLNDLIVMRANVPSHSIRIRVRSTEEIDGRAIIEQIGRSHAKFNRGTFDPTPPPRPPDFHPRDYPEGLPLSTNAIEYQLDMRIRVIE